MLHRLSRWRGAAGGATTGALQSGAFWAANILTALVFGIGHLPATAAIAPLSAVVIARALVLNGIAGIAFGWLYWQSGLEAAMLANFTADLVLHVVSPLLR
jgi:membrane protease YdiL (CAAX protease family)